ncbi:hypothetical protein E2C01_077806 [Portunus trituberculatus]|uniref:Uncharacterized protein n=1 Tax=Portunus trituberculatus TaxID=210409 RepID=A0A5B7ISF9_PORTR|nr:hypothetical protein [Portunus trituberculatus]
MSQETSRLTGEEEHSRGCCGYYSCLGWFLSLFRRKRRGRRYKHKDSEQSSTVLVSNAELVEINNEENENVMTVAENNEAKIIEEENGDWAAAEDVGEARQPELEDAEMALEEQEPKVIKTWAEEVDEAEEKGLDMFAPQTSCLLHTATVHCETKASPENEAATDIKMSATQRRRASQKALAAVRKAAAQSVSASLENEAPAAAAAETTPEYSTPIWPDVGAHGSGDGGAIVPAVPAVEATHHGTSATRRRRARRKALTAREMIERGMAHQYYR